MKFLLDLGIAPTLGTLLEADGHTFRYVANQYKTTISDKEILEIARQHGEVVITHDLDFGTLLAFSGQRFPSVILFRIHHINAQVFYDLITQNWDVMERALSLGAFVVIDSASIRIRQLPI